MYIYKKNTTTFTNSGGDIDTRNQLRYGYNVWTYDKPAIPTYNIQV